MQEQLDEEDVRESRQNEGEQQHSRVGIEDVETSENESEGDETDHGFGIAELLRPRGRSAQRSLWRSTWK